MMPKRRLGTLFLGTHWQAPNLPMVFSQGGGDVTWSTLRGALKGNTHV
jgi:hypothetical protein